VRSVRDLLADDDLPYLPELPARGPGADVVGRSAALLVEMAVDLQPAGWRFVDRPGRDLQRARSMLREDLDELAEAYDGYVGELKVQVAGPWTLVAAIDLHRGERALADPGACRDLAASLAEGLRVHLESVQRLVPGATLVVQVDEPSLPAVLAGQLATASGWGRIRAVEPEVEVGDRRRDGHDPGWGRIRAVEPEVASGRLRTVLEGAGELRTVLHCCAGDVPLPLLRSTAVSAVAIDVSLLGVKGWDGVAAAVEAGVELWAGAITTAGPPAGTRPVVDPLVRSWHEVGLAASGLADITLTPACGLASVASERAVELTKLSVDAARALTEIAHD